MTSAPSTPDLLAHELETTRTRTLALAELDDDELVRQHSVLMSPLVWDLAHIGQQEDLWLLRDGDPRRQGVLSARVEQLYDAFEHPRAERPGLPLLPPHESRALLSDVRGRVLERLERAHDLFAFAMVLQHEVQHGETMLATHQLRRLPTEQEWEKACCWDPVLGRRRRWPWGEQAPTDRHANLGGTALRPAPVGSYPAGASAYGVEQLIGDVWEWTSSPLRPWPGFTPMIYDSYSAPFFGGDYRVLRGGSWATTAGGTRPSFRNWDHPVRRQIFTGVRVAWDA